MTYVLETRWTISRGRETYGYNICTLYVNGERAARCSGGGYDMHGTVFARWLEATFQERLEAVVRPLLDAIPGRDAHSWNGASSYTIAMIRAGLYGARVTDSGHVSLHGACGFESMRRIAEHIGLAIETIESTSRKRSQWLVTDTRGES